MDLAWLRNALAQAERHVVSGQRHIDQLVDQIELLDRDGHDSTQMRELLLTFLESQKGHVQHRDRLRELLGQQPAQPAEGSEAAPQTRCLKEET